MKTTINGRPVRVTLIEDEGNIDVSINGLYIVGIRKVDGSLIRYSGMTPSSNAHPLDIGGDGRIKDRSED